MKKILENVAVEVEGGEMAEDEIKEYLDYIRNKHNQHSIETLHLKIGGEYVDMRYRLVPEPFERLRRVTGYLTADLKFWNNAKQAEERDRVKHI